MSQPEQKNNEPFLSQNKLEKQYFTLKELLHSWKSEFGQKALKEVISPVDILYYGSQDKLPIYVMLPSYIKTKHIIAEDGFEQKLHCMLYERVRAEDCLKIANPKCYFELEYLYTLIPECFQWLFDGKKEKIRLSYTIMVGMEDLYVLREDKKIFEKKYFYSVVTTKQIASNELAAIEKSKIGNEETISLKNKPKQQREHALHSIIEEVYCSNKNMSPREIWQKLQDLAKKGHGIIQEVTAWTSRPAEIHWISHENNELKMKRRTFENLISKLKSKK